MAQDYHRALSLLTDQPWAILPAKMADMLAVMEVRMAGQRLTEAEIRAAMDAQTEPRAPLATGSTAVIPLLGVISHRAGGLNEASGGTSTQRLSRQVREAIEDPGVSAIVLDVDSPGGTVTGVPELGAEILAARGRKPIVAAINGTGASAAYWLAAQADEVVITPSGRVGSVGVIMTHVDLSRADDRRGIAYTFIVSSRYKAEGNDAEPLGDGARAYYQTMVDEAHVQFVEAVAAGRGTSAGDVSANYGEGRVLTADRALEAGMVDRIEPFADTLARVAGVDAAGVAIQAAARSRRLRLAAIGA